MKGTETVLLVDDEQMVIDVSVPMLEKLGYKVTVANGGQAVIDLYQEKSEGIDIVILDMWMGLRLSTPISIPIYGYPHFSGW